MTDPRPPQPSDDPEAHLPPSHNPLPELSGGRKTAISEDAYLAAQESPEFDQLRRKFRGFAFPMTAAFLVWYFAYVLLSVYAKDFMSTPVMGNVNLGVLLGLAQFVTTFLITWLYIRHMNNNIDPLSTQLKAKLEETVS
ncbi:MAG: DUF485 domain-containing protein [Propionibacteriaceae bacterium]|nr:DUF485 domain-containing protein [Propionibacteriaceae bacterium]